MGPHPTTSQPETTRGSSDALARPHVSFASSVGPLAVSDLFRLLAGHGWRTDEWRWEE